VELFLLNYVDAYTLKLLLPSVIVVLFAIALVIFGIKKLRILMALEPDSIGYIDEHRLIKEKGVQIGTRILTGFIVLLAILAAAFIALYEPQKSSVSEREIVRNISPIGKICLVGDACNSATTTDTPIVAAVTNALPGEAKFATCAACHGADASGGVGPMLKGKAADYLVARLTAYRAKETVGPNSALMWTQASALSDNDIGELVEYITGL